MRAPFGFFNVSLKFRGNLVELSKIDKIDVGCHELLLCGTGFSLNFDKRYVSDLLFSFVFNEVTE